MSADIPAILEPLGVDRGDGKRPDGITVFSSSDGKSLCWDVTCVDSYAETNFNGYAVEPGSVARGANVMQPRKYAELGARFRFEPIAVETTGVYGRTTASVTAEIGRRISGSTGEPRESFWLAIQRGTAFSILPAAVDRYNGV